MTSNLLRIVYFKGFVLDDDFLPIYGEKGQGGQGRGGRTPLPEVGLQTTTFCASLLRPRHNFSFFSMPESRATKPDGRDTSFPCRNCSPPLPIENPTDGFHQEARRKKRIQYNLGRGGYKTKMAFASIAINRAANILRKVATQLGLNLVEVGGAV